MEERGPCRAVMLYDKGKKEVKSVTECQQRAKLSLYIQPTSYLICTLTFKASHSEFTPLYKASDRDKT